MTPTTQQIKIVSKATNTILSLFPSQLTESEVEKILPEKKG
jgi:hypothetical protein